VVAMTDIQGYSLISVSDPPTILEVLFFPHLHPAAVVVAPAAVVVSAEAAVVVAAAGAAVVGAADGAEVGDGAVVAGAGAGAGDGVGAAVVGAGTGAGVGDATGVGDGDATEAVDGVVLPLHTCIRPTDASSAFLQSIKFDLHFFFKVFIVS